MRRFVRDLFTGELNEVDDDPGAEFDSINDKNYKPAPKLTGDIWMKGHIGRTLGVHPAQAETFTKQARLAGNQDVEYDRKTGFLISRSREGRAAEAARRGHWDGQGGNVEERYAKLLGK